MLAWIVRRVVEHVGIIFQPLCLVVSYSLLAVALCGWVLYDPNQGEFQWVHYYPL